MASLSVKKLSKSFGGSTILRDISFDVSDGEFCVLVGPSGCGKSTILRLIAGLERPDRGEIAIDGASVAGKDPKDRDIAFVFQSYALYPHMSVFENLAFALRMRRVAGAAIETKVRETARLLEIDTLLDRRPSALSGGQRQRVALGRAIVREPKIFLFDEPLSNLDASLRATMRVEIARLHRRLNATIIYVTHDQAEALTLGDKIVVLHQGAIQQIGSAAEVYRRPANLHVAEFVGSPRMNLLRGTIDEASGLFVSGALHVNLGETAKTGTAPVRGAEITVGIRPEDLQPVNGPGNFVQGEVELVEDVGSDRFVHVICDGVELIARAGKDASFNRGDRVGVSANAGALHLFRDGSRVVT
jgi:ABC-type sugar transport system ATPase subunit